MSSFPEQDSDLDLESNPFAAALKQAGGHDLLKQALEERELQGIPGKRVLVTEMAERLVWQMSVLDSLLLIEGAKVSELKQRLITANPTPEESVVEAREIIDSLTPTRKPSRKEKIALQRANQPKKVRPRVVEKPKSIIFRSAPLAQPRVVVPQPTQDSIAEDLREAPIPTISLDFRLNPAAEREQFEVAQRLGERFLFYTASKHPEPNVLPTLRGNFDRFMNHTVLRLVRDQGQVLIDGISVGMGLSIPKNDPTIRRLILEAESGNPEVTRGTKSIPGWDKIHFTFLAWGLTVLSDMEDRLPEYYRFVERTAKSSKETVGFYAVTWQWYKEHFHRT